MLALPSRSGAKNPIVAAALQKEWERRRSPSSTPIGIADLNLTRQPTPKQKEWISQPARFILLVTGRRCGKTMGMLDELARRAVSKPNQTLWYIAPTYDDARDLAWEELLDIFPDRIRAKQPNQTTLTIWLKNGTKIRLVSAEKIQRRRGRGLHGVAIDEWTILSPQLWDMVIAPSLSDHQGWAIFAGTPSGKLSWAYHFWQKMQQQENAFCLSYTTVEGGLVPPEEIEMWRQTLPPRAFRQEYEASWESPSGQILDAIDERHRIPRALFPPCDEYIMAIDWGDINPCITVTGRRRDRGFDYWYLVDAWHNPEAANGVAVRDDQLLAQAKTLWAKYKCKIAYADPSRPASIEAFAKFIKIERLIMLGMKDNLSLMARSTTIVCLSLRNYRNAGMNW
ncbi:MAG: hypothetical protein CV045_12715 [Cyanobacteria bacterium M5B4]|nr:MAG: hypothetical protein CV045_12715 [Cyanobacteria bacterium M5B4]